MLENQCLSWREKFYPLVQDLRGQNLSPPDFVCSYVFRALRILRPQTWKGARLQAGDPQTPAEFFETFSFRGIPLAVNRTLKAWSSGEYRLQLFFGVPSTDEVLRLQSHGIRCVTCIVDYENLGRYVLGERDPLSFVLHDLIHADHFLKDTRQKSVQVGFSRWMRDLWQEKELRMYFHSQPEFKAAFEYACADMNSHGAHLVKYLKAIFCMANLDRVLVKSADRNGFSVDFRDALAALNTPMERQHHLSILQEELLLKGTTPGEDQEHHSVVPGPVSADRVSAGRIVAD